jgi:probable phosphomutase (TIGR03848 family)
VTLLLLVRHAVTDVTGKRLTGQLPGFHLSEQGRKQAASVAERLAPLPIAAVYASPLERCVETAEPLAAARGLSVQSVPELMDVGYGRWSGRPLAGLYRTKLWRQLVHAPSAIRFPDGESLPEVQRRSLDALESIARRHPKRAVAVFTHADVVRLAIAHYAGIHIDHFQRIVVSPASVSAVALGERVPRVVRLNDTGVLTDLVQRARPRRAASVNGSNPSRPRSMPAAERPETLPKS